MNAKALVASSSCRPCSQHFHALPGLGSGPNVGVEFAHCVCMGRRNSWPGAADRLDPLHPARRRI